MQLEVGSRIAVKRGGVKSHLLAALDELPTGNHHGGPETVKYFSIAVHKQTQSNRVRGAVIDIKFDEPADRLLIAGDFRFRRVDLILLQWRSNVIAAAIHHMDAAARIRINLDDRSGFRGLAERIGKDGQER